ncbi:MAG: hypothetical protein ACLVEJ_01770 [Parabacteroides sp.]
MKRFADRDTLTMIPPMNTITLLIAPNPFNGLFFIDSSGCGEDGLTIIFSAALDEVREK